MTAEEAKDLANETRPLWGREVARVDINLEYSLEGGHSNVMLTEVRIKFYGEPFQTARGTVVRGFKGYIYFDAVSAPVRLEEQGKILTAAFSDTDLQKTTFERLLGSTLSSIEITSPAGDTILHFSNGLDLRCFPCTSRHTAWEIELPNAQKLKMGTGGWSKS